MNKITSFIDKYIYGIIAALTAYVGIFVWLQLETYTEYFPIESFYKGSRIDIPEEEIHLLKENLEIPSDFQPANVKSISQDANDKRKKSYEEWAASQSSSDPEKSVKDYEKELFQNAKGVEERKKIQEEMENRKKNETTINKKNESSSSSSKSSPNAYAGEVMVKWTLQGRTPHQNNSWHVRNPGYTCGFGSTGKVTVRIRVNNNGDVISAEFDPSLSTSTDPCMVEQAEKYARMSRFNYSAGAVKNQEGVISYTFIAQ
jgi:hypothetical protein